MPATETIPTDLCECTARALAALIRNRRVSCREVMAAHLARVDLHNEAVNAVVTLASDTALAEAEAADRTLARGDAEGDPREERLL